ncbi:hypothetical protein AC578_10215 [Pseudocercospora eumusae]|uniref:RGS domain-containing protein n=1 Tax=Pseudocercospora eumusae TaxID=321146 RepID=A0A139HZ10_9PEZI|nr:hypothetical protein AC578_10215 [Pseudocercospora eumusae]
MGINPKGRDWGSLVNWDDLGKAYAGFIIAWTAILLAGIVWIIRNRNLPLVRMRNVPVAITSVIFLHVYLVKILLAYTTNGHFLCSAEFWIMSIYLPFGIALFQANLAQLYSISEQQKKLLSSTASVSSLLSRRSRNPLKLWNSLSQLKKTYVYIGLGMFIQFIISAVLYATTPELQGDWRSYGNVTHAKGQALCRKSLQWIPSAFWQLLWSWVFGLYTLYQIRNIRDTHYWRLGTWLCIISGLPGTPLWLAAVFNASWKPVNIRWIPPMWLAPGILVMQIVTIFFPIYEAHESRRQMRTTLCAIQDWEEKVRSHTSHSSSTNTSNHLSQPSSYGPSTQSKEIFSMASLEKALATNPMPLLHFAATKDFTAENIIFLLRLQEWRQAWTSAPRDPSTAKITSHARNLLFQLAVHIYMLCVLDTISEFPINIDHAIRKPLDSLFEPAIPEPILNKKKRNHISNTNPFDVELISSPSSYTTIDEEVKMKHLARMKPSDENENSNIAVFPTSAEKPIFFVFDEQNLAVTSSPLDSARVIRTGFDEKVFDAAEASIKDLVLTNTWRKYIALEEEECLNFL